MSYRHDFARRVRIALAILAVPTVITGLWSILAPASWYSDFGHGIAPPSAFGRYNEHFVQDLGSGYLGIGAVVVVAAIWLHRETVRAAVIGFLAFSVPHFAIHLVEGGDLSRGGYLFTNGTLAVGIVVAVWVWRLNDRRAQTEL